MELKESITKYIWYTVLTVMFAISSFERFSFAGSIKEMQLILCEDACSNLEMGLVKGIYVGVAILASPIIGHLGDRYSKKNLIIIGISIWTGCLFLTSFMTKYWPFVIANALSAIGVKLANAPTTTIIADLFDNETLVWMYGLYFLSVPIGLGLGLMLPDQIAKSVGGWRNALRISPGVTIVCALVIIFFLKDPPRNEKKEEHTSFWSDFKYIISIKSYSLFVVGRTSISCVTYVVVYWGPKLFQLAAKEYDIKHGLNSSPISVNNVSLVLGSIVMVGGVFGLITGMVLDSYLGSKIQKHKPLLIGSGSLLSIPIICACVYLANIYLIASMLLYGSFICIIYVFQPCEQSIFMLLMLPSKRVLGSSLMNMVNNIFVASFSYGLIGEMMDWLNPTESKDKDFEAIQLSFIPGFVVFAIGGICYILVMRFLNEDIKAVEHVKSSSTKSE